MSNVTEVRPWAGQLGDGEKCEGTISTAEFYQLYPEGSFRPDPPNVVVVHGVPLPAPVARALIEQESKVQ